MGNQRFLIGNRKPQNITLLKGISPVTEGKTPLIAPMIVTFEPGAGGTSTLASVAEDRVFVGTLSLSKSL